MWKRRTKRGTKRRWNKRKKRVKMRAKKKSHAEAARLAQGLLVRGKAGPKWLA
jgi:hypothetical protein